MLALKNENFVETVSVDSEVIKDIKSMIKGHKTGTSEVFNHILIEFEEESGKLIAKYSNSNLIIQKKYFTLNDSINKTTKFSFPIEEFKAVKYIKKGEVFTFEINDNRVSLVREGLKMTARFIDESEHYNTDNIIGKNNFFEMETTNEGNYATYDDLKKLIHATKSTATFETRPILKEVAIIEGNIMSTDSHRLYKASSNFASKEGIMTIPSSIIEKAKDLLDKNDLFKILLSEHVVKIESDNLIIADRINGGNYPDISKMIPNNCQLEIRVEEIHNIYKVLKSMKKNTATFVLNIEDAMLKITMVKKEKEKDGKEKILQVIESEIPVIINHNMLDRKEFQLAFNPKFVVDAIEQLEKEYITIQFSDSMRPFLIKKTNDDSVVTLHSPVRVY